MSAKDVAKEGAYEKTGYMEQSKSQNSSSADLRTGLPEPFPGAGGDCGSRRGGRKGEGDGTKGGNSARKERGGRGSEREGGPVKNKTETKNSYSKNIVKPQKK